MQRESKPASLSGLLAVCIFSVMASGCVPDAGHAPPPSGVSPQAVGQAQTPENPDDEQLRHLAFSIGTAMPQTEFLPALPGAGSCPSGGGAAVVRAVLNERILFAPDSDQPVSGATAALDFLADNVRSFARGAEVTVLGHTDAVGSDEYNLGLSKRRAAVVLQALVGHGLSPERLSAVAVGKRQPIADNATPEGRARNRRVEFLISPCLAANLETVKSVQPGRTYLQAADEAASAHHPADVLRLQQIGQGDFLLNAVSAVSLNNPYAGAAADARPLPAARVPRNVAAPSRPSQALSAVQRVFPSRAPEVKPNVPAPGPEQSKLGPAISY